VKWVKLSLPTFVRRGHRAGVPQWLGRLKCRWAR